MSLSSQDASEAVVICTRNRPGELAQTLQSVAAQPGTGTRPVLVVDGSDSEESDRTARVVEDCRREELPFYYHRYSGAPAGTRQRNAGVDLLPPSVDVVHFLDDDVTVKEQYFEKLSNALAQHPPLLGVGGIIKDPTHGSPRPSIHLGHRLFLLRTDHPSRVLPSGHVTPAWPLPNRPLQSAEWLATGASSYRRAVFDRHRFDPAVAGQSPRLEDLDFSFRVSQDGPLAVVPDAECIHRTAATDRRNNAAIARERVARRYWFVKKNLDHPFNRLAFWWSIVGRMLALAVSSHPESNAILRGLLRGIRTVLSRSHPLLSA